MGYFLGLVTGVLLAICMLTILASKIKKQQEEDDDES